VFPPAPAPAHAPAPVPAPALSVPASASVPVVPLLGHSEAALWLQFLQFKQFLATGATA
jgi:hypothetical protein